MVTLSLKDGGVLGSISDEDFQILADYLEEESEADVDYYIGPDTIVMLEDDGASPALLALLKEAVGDSEGADVVWTRD